MYHLLHWDANPDISWDMLTNHDKSIEQWKNLGCLGCIRDNTIQLYGVITNPIQQPGSNGKQGGFLTVAQLTIHNNFT